MNREAQKTSKKPVYKKWWFWLIIVIVLAGIGGAVNQDSNEAEKVGENNTSSQPENNGGAKEQTEFKVGDVIAYDNKQITVMSVERNYSASNQYAKPDSGKEYVKVNITIENKSDDKISYNALDWQIQNGDGAIENYMASGSTMAQADDSMSSGDLAKGGKKSGSIVFQVPKDDSGLILHYSPSFWSNKSVEIKL